MNLKKTLLAILLIAIIILVFAPKAKDYLKMAKSREKIVKVDTSLNAAIKDWKNMGFGVFIHWTPAVAFQSRYKGMEVNKDLWGEWFMKRTDIPVNGYEDYIKGWNPKDFNADEWADIFDEAGFKYMVFVAKHHDGFALFDSKANNYSITKYTSFKRDPFKELCAAMQKRGLKTGFYYSHGTDWRNKIGLTGTPEEIDQKYFEQTIKPQLQDLSANYGKQTIAWFDLGWKNRSKLAQTCIDILRKNNPDILVSSRIGSGLGDFSAERDGYIPPIPRDGNWETCMTLNDHWDWTPSDKTQKSYPEIIQMLATIRARGGNMLLNVGPDVRGCIPLRERTTLIKIGHWLKNNGESIYGVQKAPYTNLPWGVCTHKFGKLFLHLMKMPTLDYVFLPGLKSEISKVYFLADKEKNPLKFTKVEGGWNIELKTDGIPDDVFNEASTVLVAEYEGELEIDSTPVLDQDFDNRFIVPLAKKENGAIGKTQRITPIWDHPGVQEPEYVEFACGFSHKNAKVSWKYNLMDKNRFCINVEYANLTGRKLKAIVKIGGKTHDIELQPTNNKANPWAIFTLVTTGSEILDTGKGQILSFEMAEENSLDDLDEMYKTPNKREQGLKKFMLKTIILKPFYPLPYEGYSYCVK